MLGGGKDERGYRMLDAAFALVSEAESSALRVELWFYALAHHRSPQERLDAIHELRGLVESGARSPGWDLSMNVTRAVEDGHQDAVWLPKLAAVISDGADPSTLDDWPAWRDASDE